ncbi:hypothetical protein A0256_20810 [Mucilaginibacter sp. PAMC 26640]|nr:hypothetical protein A0256_14485 [Mucilaginibacter sp. PAMC 26640]AMR33697.1 hypothetical protein A0256_20810 [Mucilaginibacter sp. PAMC 26640]
MKSLTLLLIVLTLTARAQTPVQRDSAKRDSAHRQYHLMRRDPKQNYPYAFADSAKAKKPVGKPNKKTR